MQCAASAFAPHCIPGPAPPASITLPHFNGDATAVKQSFFHTGIRTPASFPNNSNTISPSCQPDSECEIQHS